MVSVSTVTAADLNELAAATGVSPARGALAGLGPVVPHPGERAPHPMDVLRSLTRRVDLIGEAEERVLAGSRANPLDERRAAPDLVASTVPTRWAGPLNPLDERRTAPDLVASTERRLDAREPLVTLPGRPAPPNALDRRRSGPAHVPTVPTASAAPPNPLDSVMEAEHVDHGGRGIGPAAPRHDAAVGAGRIVDESIGSEVGAA